MEDISELKKTAVVPGVSAMISASLALSWCAALLVREVRLPDIASLSLLRECLLPANPGSWKLIPDVRDAMLSEDIVSRCFWITKIQMADKCKIY